MRGAARRAPRSGHGALARNVEPSGDAGLPSPASKRPKRAGATRSADSLALSLFGDAVRGVLGLEPIYYTGRHESATEEERELRRFYVEPFGRPDGMVPRRAGAD